MEQKFEMEQEIEATLNCLDSVTRAEPKPYFYTRLKARMERRQENMGWSFPYPRLVIASLTVCIALIFFAIFDMERTAQENAMATNQTQIDHFATEYGLRTTSNYDLK